MSKLKYVAADLSIAAEKILLPTISHTAVFLTKSSFFMSFRRSYVFHLRRLVIPLFNFLLLVL